MYPLAPGESSTEGTNLPLNDIDVLDLSVSWLPKGGSGDLLTI
jgi:hypothetical protein